MNGLSRLALAVALGAVPCVAACGSTATTSPTASASVAAPAGASAASTQAGLQQAKWGSNVQLIWASGYVEYRSDGIPNHARPSEYAVPSVPGTVVPNASTARAMSDPTSGQSYDIKITTNPSKAASPTNTSGGPVGFMVSGAALFNPYEGDGTTVALAGNFTVKDEAGRDVAFIDTCNGHPGPGGQYHYHGLPRCIASVVDGSGPSHVIGVALDGFPIYGDRDLNGAQITADQLDRCNGITSPTPEFPRGIYHYVLLDTTSASSSLRCLAGTVDPSLTQLPRPGTP